MSKGLRPPLGMAALLVVAAVIALFAVYRTASAAWTVDVGGPFSGALVTGFYADEAEQDGRSRARWSTGHGEVTFRDTGLDGPAVLSFGVGARPADAPAPVVLTASVGSHVVATYTLGTQAAVLTIPSFTAGGDVTLGLDVPTFRPSGDRRDLGVKLEWVRLEAAPGASPPSPWGVLLAVIAGVLGVYALLGGLLRRPVLAGVGGLLALAAVAYGLGPWRPLITPWLPGAAAALVIAGAAAQAWRAARHWPMPAALRWTDGVGEPSGALRWAAPALLAVALAGYAAFALAVLPQMDWIGHADYAENAVVARNLAVGRGPVVDYVAQFYAPHPGITHPAETWPLLQPILTAPFFVLLGAQGWAARLPNLLLLLGLAVTVYSFGRRWWDRRVGLLAALLALLHPYFFFTVLYPINDLGFTLLAFLTVGFAWEASVAQDAAARTRVAEASEDEEMPRETLRAIRAAPRPGGAPTWRLAALAGLAAGLLVWSKGPSAAVVLGGLAVALLLHRRSGRWAGRRPAGSLRPLLWAVAAFGVAVVPLLGYNLLTFHAPFYSTESLDIWILRFWTGGTGPPWENIYADYLNGRPLPSRALLLHSYSDLYNAVGWGFGQLGKDVLNGSDLPALPMTVLGLLGWLVAVPRRLRGLRLAWVVSLGSYCLFVLLAWHYESRYFQALVPWLALGAAAVVAWVADRGAVNRQPSAVSHQLTIHTPQYAIRNARGAGGLVAGVCAAVMVVGLVVQPLPALAHRAETETGPDNFAAAGRWAAAHLPPDAVVMIRNPWEFNWYAQRKAVMIPEGSLDEIKAVAAEYGVGYIWLGGPADSTSRRPPLREALAPLYRRAPLPGLPATLIYDVNGYYIYRLGQ